MVSARLDDSLEGRVVSEPEPTTPAPSSRVLVEPLRVFPVARERDRLTLEMVQVFPIPKDSSLSNYSVDAYFFVPRSFGINSDTFPREAFYQNAQVFLRLTAPSLKLAQLADLEHPHTPAAVLRRYLPELLEDDPPSSQNMAALAQMLGAELADAVRRESEEVMSMISDVDDLGAPAIKARVERYCSEARQALHALRRVRAKARAYQEVADETLFHSLSFAEEYSSAILDERLARIADRLDRSKDLRDGSGIATALRLRIARTAAEVNQRRRSQGFAVPWGKSSEYFTYRMGLLKKELQRALYIDTRRLVKDPFYRNTAAMVAAGIAATWATLAQLPLWRGGWTTRQGFLFLLAAVGAYILKDRIKEWVREGLLRRFVKWDHDQTIRGEALANVGLGNLIGRAKELVRFEGENEIPKGVREMRRARRTVRGASLELENVLHYTRSISLAPETQGSVPDGFAVREIFRLSLEPFLSRLDAPKDMVDFYESATGKFASRAMPRVYHLNLVLVSTDNVTQLQRMVRYRVVLNKKGIKRVDLVAERAGDAHERLKTVV